MSTATSQFLSNLNGILSLSLGIVHVAFGTVGTALNLCVYFRSKTWRTSCGLYLSMSYIFGFGVVMAGQLPRLINPTPTFLLTTFWQCQIRGYLIQTFGLIARMLLVLASFDRMLVCSTNVRRRQWSNHKRTKGLIPLVILLSFLLYMHMPITHDYRPQSRVCYSSLEWLITLDFAYQLLFVGIIPGGLISLFSIKLIIYLREQRIRLAREFTSRDKQLVWMLLAQVVVYTIIHTIALANMTYGRITLYHSKTRDRAAIENFITFLINSQLVYFYFSMTFALNFFSSPSFRRDLMHFWKKPNSQTTSWKTPARVAPQHPSMPIAKSLATSK